MGSKPIFQFTPHSSLFTQWTRMFKDHYYILSLPLWIAPFLLLIHNNSTKGDCAQLVNCQNNLIQISSNAAWASHWSWLIKSKICLGPIPQQTPLNQSATLPPPIVVITSTTATPTRPTTTQAENVATGTPAVATTEVCLVYNCVFFFAFRFEGSKIKWYSLTFR